MSSITLNLKTILFFIFVIQMPLVSAEVNVISIGNASTHNGNTITIPVMIYNSTGISGGGLNLSYSPNIVSVVAATPGEFTDFFAFDDSNTLNGYVMINTFRIGIDLTGDAVFANITFHAKEPGVSPLVIDVLSLADMYGYEVERTVRNGTFTVYQCICGDVTGDGVINTGDVILLANNVSYPGQSRYALRCR